MHLFPDGLVVTRMEYDCFLHLVDDPEQFVLDALLAKAVTRRDALINGWFETLLADPDVKTIPTDPDAIAALIIARPDYQTRVQKDAALPIPEPVSHHKAEQYKSKIRQGDTVTLFTTRIFIPDAAAACILAFVQDMDELVYNAVLGCISKGRKLILRQYLPILAADPRIVAVPGNEDELLDVITSLDDYMTMPEQKAEIERRIRVAAEEREAERLERIAEEKRLKDIADAEAAEAELEPAT